MSTSVTLPASVKKVSWAAFDDTPIPSVSMEGPVEYLGASVFGEDATSVIHYAGTSDQFDAAVRNGQPDDNNPYPDFIDNEEKTLYCTDGTFKITLQGLVSAQE